MHHVRAVLAILTICIAPAFAQESTDAWPSRPITLVVPFAAGGGNDVLARIIAQPLSEILKQPVVIENVAGAGGMTGGNRVAKAAPDGYTPGSARSAATPSTRRSTRSRSTTPPTTSRRSP